MRHDVELVTLKNGAKGLFINVPGASVTSFDFNFRAGDYLSPKGKWDTAHIMEHMVLGANKRYESSIEFSKVFEQNGAYNNASTGTYHMSYIAECADFETERILDLLCLSIESPLFLESEFKAEKANVREELKSRRNNHGHELSLALSDAMGQYELTYTERAKLLDSITLNDVIAHYKKTHTAQNLRFIIGGNLTKSKANILKRIESIKLAQGSGRISLPSEKMQTVSKPLINKKTDVENLYYRYEVDLGPLLATKDLDALQALNGLLFGSMHSRIFGKARELGLAYGIGYGDYRTRDNSLFWIGGQILPENVEPLFKLFADELKDISNGNLAETELESIRLSSLGSYKRSTQTVGQLVDGYLSWFIFDDKIEDYFDMPKRIKAVTSKSVIDMAKLIQASKVYGFGFAGATNNIDAEQLAKIIKN